jgi:hypothetical protein
MKREVVHARIYSQHRYLAKGLFPECIENAYKSMRRQTIQEEFPMAHRFHQFQNSLLACWGFFV